MVELTPNNQKTFNKSAELRFVAKAKQRVREYMDDELLDNIRNCYSDESIDSFTELGIKRAREHHLISEGEIFDYLRLMIFFGAYFDLDHHYHWLNEYIEGDPDRPMRGYTIHGLRTGQKYQKMRYSPVAVWLTRFEQLQQDYAGFDLMATIPLGKNQLVEIMKAYNPDDELILFADMLEKIYAQILPEMERYKITAPDSQIIWFILSVDSGFRFYDNPLYPEIPAILNSDTTEKEKLKQLLQLKITCLKKRLKNTQKHKKS